MKVNVATDKVLDALRRHLAEHEAELTEATAEWRMRILAALAVATSAVSEEGAGADFEELKKLLSAKPADNRAEYNKRLDLAEKSEFDHIELSEEDHDNVFDDTWQWRHWSKTTNAAYTRKG